MIQNRIYCFYAPNFFHLIYTDVTEKSCSYFNYEETGF